MELSKVFAFFFLIVVGYLVVFLIQNSRFELMAMWAKPSNDSALPYRRRRVDEADVLWLVHERLEESYRPSNDARRIQHN